MTENLIFEKTKIMSTNQIKDQDIVDCIENYAIDNAYWMDKQQVADELQVSVEALREIIQLSSTIVINAEGELTTRKLYKQKTPFYNKLLNTIKNKID